MNPLIDQWLDDYHLALITIGTLKEEESTSLIESLKSIPPLLDNERLANIVLNLNPCLDKEVADNLLELLFSIYNLSERSDISIDEIITQITQSIKEDEELSSEISLEESQKISLRLNSLLDDNGTIAASYKAMVILKDHKCVFNDCRVFTDVRPIFGVDTTVNPVGMGIIHMLKIMYVGLDGPNELFIGLDYSDLEQIGEEIQRAIIKETTIRSMFAKSDIHCV
ncbi:hypothetical protein [Chamaesiphon polymorphus]|uniref:Uncharacterized protein n=1 Tax=Chamaesiphon polymorphus CCALA 037 TaxID=2107692 RepID=A0A2T1GHQ3_9CYAN|nr:hypothetical protein [Chamaesiphon polymorphus]PSB57242.1 hypothetical protein C7B77_09120 [Chamaesiphon polymorphus CCALA 037]